MTNAAGRWALLALAAGMTLAGCGREAPSTSVPLAGGDGGGLPRSEPAAEQVDAAAMQAAMSVAAQGGARVLLVARHGHLLFEHHASGTSATDLIDGGGMAQALAALAAGAAVAEGKLTADTSRFDATSLAASLSAATGLPYADYVSRRVWQPLNAAAARFTGDAAGAVRADCCLAARAGDWLRLGIVLLQTGSFEGNTIVAADWVARMRRPLADDAARGFGVWLPVNGRDPEPAGAEPFAARDVYFLRGANGTRLWLAPSLQLAVLYVAAPGAATADHTGFFNQVIRAVQDRPQESRDQSLLQQLVPGH
jgi:CubicO group peptidase (beta-lactamase class C family)